MTLSLLFYFVSALTIGSALLVVLNRNAVYSAVLLVFTFFNLSILYLLLEAYFLAVLEILIYAGAIMVLFLFVIMLLNVGRERVLPKMMSFQRAVSLFLLVIFFIGVSLFTIQGVQDLHQPAGSVSIGNVTAIGEALFSKYLFPFEIASILLLVALIGTVYLAKRKI
ncbi:MAG: NADH-quinone oxidoreductase subunit J [Candidatus Marinimicrobia bacterium]|nr:NADH-quinone oxidoreductase subunit J [Candidatus Neomarinimicrobiota bacterium]